MIHPTIDDGRRTAASVIREIHPGVPASVHQTFCMITDKSAANTTDPA